MKTTPDPIESFESGVLYLQRFLDRTGHTAVPHQSREGYFSLGRWVGDVRAKRHDLTSNQQEVLEHFNSWTWDQPAPRTRNDATFDFDHGYELLLAEVRSTGTARVRQMEAGEVTALGTWVKQVRDRYRDGTLANAQIAQLEETPNWAWREQDAAYEDHVVQLKAFARREGHVSVPASYKDPSGFGLGAWVAEQAKKHREGKLPPERSSLLSSVPGWDSK